MVNFSYYSNSSLNVMNVVDDTGSDVTALVTVD